MLDLENRSVNEIHDLCLPSLPEKRIASELSWNSMSGDWKQHLTESGRQHFFDVGCNEGVDEKLIELRNLLLSYGGESVCLPNVEEDLHNILERGVLWSGNDAEKMIGRASQCHANASNLWAQNKDKTVIATGYALSQDGMWRQHSWLFAFDEETLVAYIVETTTPRAAYFGFAMTYGESAKFADENW